MACLAAKSHCNGDLHRQEIAIVADVAVGVVAWQEHLARRTGVAGG